MPFLSYVVCVCVCMSFLLKCRAEWKRKLCFRHLRDICICFSSLVHIIFCLFVILIQCCMKLNSWKGKTWRNYFVRSYANKKKSHAENKLKLAEIWYTFVWLTSSSCVCERIFHLIWMQSTYVKLSHINNVNIQ